MSYGLQPIENSPPDWIEPVTIDETAEHCRITGDFEDTYLEALIAAAREHCEKIQGSALVRRNWELTLDCFPAGRVIDIPLRPVVSVQSIEYIDDNDVMQTLDAELYIVDAKSFRPRIELKAGESWPDTADRINAITITFTAGAAVAPKAVRHAVLLLVGHWYENREASTVGAVSREIDFAVTALLSPERNISI